MRLERMIIAGLVLLLTITLQASASPVVRVSLTPTVLAQGGAFSLIVSGDVPDGTVQVRFAGRTWPLYQESDRWRIYLGTDPYTAAGVRAVVIEIMASDGVAVLARRSVTVRRVDFPKRHLTFDPEILALLEDPKLVEEEQTKVAAALRTLEPARLWSGLFGMPVVGPFTSPYGVISIYQGEAHGWHRGVDIAAPTGEIVRAANAGVVRLAEPLPLSGDAVILDHGMGVLTMYFHMSTIEVMAGQHTSKGDVIGRVGSTGLATGPHLHWGLRVNGVYVDPLLWTK